MIAASTVRWSIDGIVLEEERKVRGMKKIIADVIAACAGEPLPTESAVAILAALGFEIEAAQKMIEHAQPKDTEH